MNLTEAYQATNFLITPHMLSFAICSVVFVSPAWTDSVVSVVEHITQDKENVWP